MAKTDKEKEELKARSLAAKAVKLRKAEEKVKKEATPKKKAGNITNAERERRRLEAKAQAEEKRKAGLLQGQPHGYIQKATIDLRNDILVAYEKLGAVAWLQKLGEMYPKLFVSLLERALEIDDKAKAFEAQREQQNHQIKIVVDTASAQSKVIEGEILPPENK